MRIKLLGGLLCVGAMVAWSTAGPCAVNVVASTPELADITRAVGAKRISVVSLARPDQDYHKVEARPSLVTQVARASVLVRLGMDMDMWVDALINASQNRKVARGAAGYVDVSQMIRKLEVPKDKITGASGDIHVYGNPHYWLDPGNAKVIAYQILLALRKADSGGASAYDSNYKRFAATIDSQTKKWQARLAPYKGKPVVAYHAEWVYFCRKFGLKEFGYLEPKPGIPPSAGHISSLISRMKASKVKAVIVPTIYPMRFADVITKATGAKAERVPYSVGSMGTRDYITYMDAIVSGFEKALK